MDTRLTVGTVSAPLKVGANTAAVVATGFQASLGGFVTLKGDFGFSKSGADIQVVAQGASALLIAGGVEVGVKGAELALLLPAKGGVQLQASGSPVLTLPGAFGSISVAQVTVSYNNTADAVDTRLTVGTVSAPLKVGANTAAVVAAGFQASLGGFVTLKGDFGFSKSGADIQVVAQGASALLTAGGVEVGVTGAELAVLLPAKGGVQLQASGSPVLTLPGTFGSISATQVTVSYNNTADAVDTRLTVGSVSAPLKVAANVAQVSVSGFRATVANFVSLSGDLAIQKDSAGRVLVVGQAISASLEAGSAYVRVVGADLGLKIADGLVTFEVSKGRLEAGLPGFTDIASDSFQVQYNDASAAPVSSGDEIVVGDRSYRFTRAIASGGVAFSVVGFRATLGGFGRLGGDFGFKKSGSDLTVVASKAYALVTAGAVEVGVTDASLALLLPASGGLVFQASGSPKLTLPGVFSGIQVEKVSVLYNNTTADREGLTLEVGDVRASLSVQANTIAVSVTGFEAVLTDFVRIRGNLAFQKQGDSIAVVGAGIEAVLTAGEFQAGVTGGSFGLLLPSSGGVILQASGTPVLRLPGALAEVSMKQVTVYYNSTDLAVKKSLTVGALTAAIDVPGRTIAVVVEGFRAVIGGSVQVSGNFGFQKSGDNLSIVVSGAQASLTAGSFEVGIRNATLGALIKPNGTVALQATGSPYLTLPKSVTSVIDLQIRDLSVSYNDTGEAVDRTLTAGSLSVPIQVGKGGKADPYLAVGGSVSLTIAGFINVSGSFGFARQVDTTTGRTMVLIGAANVTGSAGSDEFTLTNGDLGLVLFEQTATGNSLGYALDGAIRGRAKAGDLTAEATVRIRRNTTQFEVNAKVPVQTWSVPVVFTAEETANSERTAFSSIGIENAVITLGDITVRGSYKTLPVGALGESVTQITDAELVFGNPTLFSIRAASVIYKQFKKPVTLGGVAYSSGVAQILVVGGQIDLGSTLSLFGNFNIILGSGSGDSALTRVAFANLGFSIQNGSETLIRVAGAGEFHYGGPDGFQLDRFAVTSFDLLPGKQTAPTNFSNAEAPAIPDLKTGAVGGVDSDGYELLEAEPNLPTVIKLGPVTLVNPTVNVTGFGVSFTKDFKIKLTVSVTVGVTSGAVELSGFAASITDSKDTDEYGIAGTFGIDVFLDPLKSFAPSGVGLGGFNLMVDTLNLKAGNYLSFTATGIAFDPGVASTAPLLAIGSAAVSVTAGPVSLGGGAKNFGILGNGTIYTADNFAITLSLGASGTSGMGLPSWLPLESLSLALFWQGDNFRTDPANFRIIIDAQVKGIEGLPLLQVSGGFRGLTIDVGLLAQGAFPIIGIDSFNVSVSGMIGGFGVKAGLVLGILKMDQDFNPIESTDLVTPVAKRTLYAGLIGGMTIPGLGGVFFRMGLCDFGPLSIFLNADVPLLFEPITGLSLGNFSAGIDFGATLAAPTIYAKEANGDPVIDPATGAPKVDITQTAFNLRNVVSGSNPASMTASQWEGNLRKQISTIMKNGGGNVSFADLFKNMVIRGGARLFSSYISAYTFFAEVTVQIDITGKILMTGTATFGGPDYGLSLAAYFFGDLSQLASGNARLIFLMDLPGRPWRDVGGVSLYGLLDLALVDSLGNRITQARIQEKYYIDALAQEEFTGNGSAKTYVLENLVSKSAPINVTVGGKALASTDYQISSGSRLQLNTAAANGEKVVVNYSYKTPYRDPATGKLAANPNSKVPEPAGVQILIGGGLRADFLGDFLFIELSGQVVMTLFVDSEAVTFSLDASANLAVSGLGVLGAAAGNLTLRVKPPKLGQILDPRNIEIFGALRMGTGDGLKMLEKYGLVAQAQMTLVVNTTDVVKPIDLQLAAMPQASTEDAFIRHAGDSGMLMLTHSISTGAPVQVSVGSVLLKESADGGKTGDYILDRYNSVVRLLAPITQSASYKVSYGSKNNLEVHVQAAPKSLSLVASGVLAFNVGTTEYFRIDGGFAIRIESKGFTLMGAGTLRVGSREAPLLELSVNALLFLGVDGGTLGFAGIFQASGGVSRIPGLTFKASLLVAINTFGHNILFTIPEIDPAFPTIRDEQGRSLETAGTQTVAVLNSDGTQQTDSSGKPLAITVPVRRVTITGGARNPDGTTLNEEAYLQIRASGEMNLADAFVVRGSFSFLLTLSKFEVAFDGLMKLGPLGEASASGFLRIDTTGVYGAFVLKVNSSFGAAVGLRVSASVVMEINTTASVQTVYLGATPRTVARGALVRLVGTYNFLGLLDTEGTLFLQYDAAVGRFTMNGSLIVNVANLLNSKVAVAIVVDSTGLVLTADVVVDANVVGIASITAVGKLYINTRATRYTTPNGKTELAAKSVLLALSGSLKIMGIFSMNVGVTVQVGGTFVRPATAIGGGITSSVTLGVGEWAFAFSGSSQFMGVATLNLSGWLQSNGSFGGSLSGSVGLGDWWLGLSGSMTGKVYFDSTTDVFGFSGSVSANAKVFGFSIGLPSVGIQYSSNSGKLQVYAEYTSRWWAFGWYEKKYTYWFDLGTFQRPVKGVDPSSLPVPTLVDSTGKTLANGATLGSDGTFVLDLTKSADANPVYTIRSAGSGGAGSTGEAIEVVYQGRVTAINGVRKIQVKGAQENATVSILNGITSQVVVNDTGGSNTYTVSGGSVTLMNQITTGSGNDTVLVRDAGTGVRFTLNAGDGVNTVMGTGNADVITGGKGTDYITGGGGDDVITLGSGTSYVAGDDATFEMSADGLWVTRFASIDISRGNDTITSTGGTAYILGGDGADVITTAGGNDILVGDEGVMTFGTDGIITSVASLNPKNFGNDRISAGGGKNVIIAGGGIDTVTVEVGESVVLGDGGTVSFAGASRTPSKLTGHGSATIVVASGSVTVDESTRTDALTVSAAGNLSLSSVMTAGAASVVSLVSSGGSVTVTEAVGSAGLLEIVGSGAILVRDVRGGIRLAKVESLNGGVQVSGTGDVWVDLVRGRTAPVTLTSTGDLRIGLAQATGSTLTATAGGRIEEIGSDSNADLIAKVAILKAAAGIGSLGILETLVQSLSMATDAGILQVLNQADLTLISAVNSAANGGQILVSVQDGDLRATDVRALGLGALIQLQTLGSGDIRPGYVSADRGDVLLKSAGFIEALVSKDDAHVVGGRVKLDAAAVGNEGPVNVVELNGGLKSLTGLPDLRTLVGTGWTERTYNSLTGSGATLRLNNLLTRVSTTPAGDSVRLWQTGLVTPTTTAADNFGTVATGWIRASEAGNYHFWTLGDEAVQLWIYGLDGQPMGGGIVASTTAATARDQWSRVTRSAAVALQANTYYRVEVRFVELTGGEFFQVGYAKAGATAPTTPQAILGSTKPITTGATTPLSLVPDFAGQAMTLRLSAGLGGLIDAGRVGARDSSATVGSATVPNLTIQGDRTETVTLIGSMADIQAFIQNEGNLRYSVVNDAWLKVSLTSARLATTTDGVKFTTAAYTAESVEAVRLLASAASGSDSTGTARSASGSLAGVLAQWSENEAASNFDAEFLMNSVEAVSGGSPGLFKANDVIVTSGVDHRAILVLVPVTPETVTLHELAAEPVNSAANSASKPTAGQPYRVVTAASVPLDQAFAGRMGQGAAAPVFRSLSVVGGDSPMSVASMESLNLEEFQTTKKTGQRSNRAVRGVKGVLV